jgi:hypothetical protein
MKFCVGVLVALSACAFDANEDVSQVDQDSVPIQTLQGTAGQGTSMQGTSMQGTSMQGTSMQGTSMQGTSMQGASQGGSSASYAKVDGTAISYWVRTGSLKTSGWEQRFPNKVCYWNSLRTYQTQPCVKRALSTSPLLGSRWPTTFTRTEADGSITTIPVTLEIQAVRSDPTYAMFAINGSAYATAAPVWCENPKKCRPNSDIYNYDVRVIDVFDANGQPVWLCPSGQTAIPLAGTWNNSTWYYDSTTASTKFTFACTNGVLAKCTRWGYRPYDRAIKDNTPAGTQPVSLAGYHQSCIRAAAADYCGIGKSMTKNGTLVDVFDYSATWEQGFIPHTDGYVYPVDTVTAFSMEAWFDNDGAATVDRTRYAELSGNPDWSIDATCPTKFWASQEFAPYNKVAPQNGPLVYIDSATACSHSEFVVGKYLSSNCSYCTHQVGGNCTDPAHGWTQECVDYAKQSPYCSATQNQNLMTFPHNECQTGVALNKYDTGCTLTVCLQSSGCCDPAVGWSSTCTQLADTTCKGGQENMFQGFCGAPSTIGTLQ